MSKACGFFAPGVSKSGTIEVKRSEGAIAAEIAELERLLRVLPSEHSGPWCDFYLHRCIKAQLGVLQTRTLPPDTGRNDVDDSALWAAQWLADSTWRDDQGPAEEWRDFERDIKRGKAA